MKPSLTMSGVLLLALGFGVAVAQEPPFGNDEDTAYAEALWRALAEARLVGEDAFVSKPYDGTEPHGVVLTNLEGDVTVEGHTGIAIAKSNYMDTTIEEVWNAPDQNVDSITVMFKREAGYDPDNRDWFWAKYNPDGSLQTNPQGQPLAGRVAKGAEEGCIACHQTAEGGDYVFNHDRLTQ